MAYSTYNIRRMASDRYIRLRRIRVRRPADTLGLISRARRRRSSDHCGWRSECPTPTAFRSPRSKGREGAALASTNTRDGHQHGIRLVQRVQDYLMLIDHIVYSSTLHDTIFMACVITALLNAPFYNLQIAMLDSLYAQKSNARFDHPSPYSLQTALRQPSLPKGN